MKKLEFLLVLLAQAFIGCSQEKNELCECHELQLKMAKEFKALEGNLEAIKEIQAKYETRISACTIIVAKMQEELKTLPAEEKEKRKQAYLKECPAFEELMDMKKKK